MKESNLGSKLDILFSFKHFINLKYFELYKASKILIHKIDFNDSFKQENCVLYLLSSYPQV